MVEIMKVEDIAGWDEDLRALTDGLGWLFKPAGAAGDLRADGALVLDDTQVIKKGAKSVGVAPQHCGLTGQTENCQVMVMLIYASRHGHAFVDRALYLPRVWTADPQRCAAAGVSTDVEFVTKPHLGVAMLGRALADAALAFSWFVADSGYGARPGP